MESHLPSLSDIITKQLLFLERSEVQTQVLIILISLTISWILSKKLWRWLQKEIPQWTRFTWQDLRFSPRQYLAILIQTVDFPLISLILLNFNLLFFSSQEWTRGLIRVAIQLMLVYLFYRCLLAILYGTFPIKDIKKYHYRLLAPVLIIFILKTLINLYSNLKEISQVSPFFSEFW